ncbi:hypothetical protein H2200_011793 [Cladophialophora chaetospira]|uniref:Uncharacterized protein n=1 Tax=Cladophialophora chaetospira TaxID=386627 RepID=A0AA39CCX1_9EURO|nr:hypothetical protein H2200_011793 [Cladophialophora chaetospira]
MGWLSPDWRFRRFYRIKLPRSHCNLHFLLGQISSSSRIPARHDTSATAFGVIADICKAQSVVTSAWLTVTIWFFVVYLHAGAPTVERGKFGADDGCLNCLRASFPCPGYRNETNLRFHDESTRIVEKVEQRTQRKLVANAAVTFYGGTKLEMSIKIVTPASIADKNETKSRSTQRAGRPARLLLQPWLSLDDTLYDFFYLHYVVEAPRKRPAPPAYATTSRLTPAHALNASIKAVASAGVACYNSSSDCETSKQQLYGTAVKSINSLLRDPSAAKQDQTLLAVLLLNSFEEMDLRSTLRLDARRAHLFGAVSLLRLRGFEQLRMPIEIRLFGQLASALANFCIEHQLDLPGELHGMMRYSAAQVRKGVMSWHVFQHKLEFTSFYVRTVRNIVSDAYSIFRKALEFERWLADTPRLTNPGWGFKVFQTDQASDLIVNGTYHIYKTYMAVMVWNGMRGYRLLTNRLILESTWYLMQSGGPVSLEVKQQHEAAKRTIRKLQLEILATVPQHLGLISRTQPEKVNVRIMNESAGPRFFWTAFESSFHNPTLSSKRDETLPLTRMFGGCLLPFSLYLVDLVDLGGPESLAKPVLHILKTISDRMAVQQAAHYAEKVEARAGQQKDLLKFRHLS